MSPKKTITCIVCPKGCKIDIRQENNELYIKGYSCKRGKDYATNEYYNPSRVLTTTIRIKGASIPLIPVKSSNSVPKGKLFEIMDLIALKEVSAPVKMGDILIENILDTDIDIVATRSLENV